MDSEILTVPLKTPPGFPWLESELPARLGCPPTTLTKIRYLLQEGRDWTTFKRRICYTTAAIKDAASGLGLQRAELSWLYGESAPETAPAPQGPPVVTLTVSKHKTVNPHIILALDVAKRLVRVRVKSKENFRPFMEIKAEHQAGDLYLLVGNCPRFPGKF